MKTNQTKTDITETTETGSESPTHVSRGVKTFAMPEDPEERRRLSQLLESFVENHDLVPPLSIEELREQAKHFIALHPHYQTYRDLITVLINNCVWKETIASIPYERRILLMPQCLRSSTKCRAEIDEFGLLCEQCGSCSIGDIQAEAEELGYIVLIAEGTTFVTKLLEGGKVDAVVGVSCLAVLEKTFPQMASDAIPGIAIPLIFDGCIDTSVDTGLLLESVRLTSGNRWFGQAEITELRATTDTWFTPAGLDGFFTDKSSRTEEMAVAWLARAGKRWRPFLAAAVFKALNGVENELPVAIQKLAIAVECFHKASLIHDDIEDDDDYRYGEATLHMQHGVPIALNTGDLLLGEGYRLIANSGLGSEAVAAMLAAASAGHHRLCIGQGEELLCVKSDTPPSSDKVISIFQDKTSPAFEVALCLGAIAAGAGEEILGVLKRFSNSLGIAFQIQDDLEDFRNALDQNGNDNIRPSLILPLALESADQPTQEAITAGWQSRDLNPELLQIIADLKVEEKMRQLCEHYKHEAIRSLIPLKNAPLKALLRKIIGKIVGKAK